MSYAYRRDNRTDEEFKRDIKYRTENEKTCMGTLIEQVNKFGMFAAMENTGVDNTGEVIFDNSVNGFPDYRIYWEWNELKKCLSEIKISPVSSKATFKEVDLNRYLNADYGTEKMIMTVFVGTNMWKPGDKLSRNAEWFVIKRDQIPLLMEAGEYTRSDYRFGGKSTYMISRSYFEAFSEVKKVFMEDD